MDAITAREIAGFNTITLVKKLMAQAAAHISASQVINRVKQTKVGVTVYDTVLPEATYKTAANPIDLSYYIGKIETNQETHEVTVTLQLKQPKESIMPNTNRSHARLPDDIETKQKEMQAPTARPDTVPSPSVALMSKAQDVLKTNPSIARVRVNNDGVQEMFEDKLAPENFKAAPGAIDIEGFEGVKTYDIEKDELSIMLQRKE